MYKNTDCSFSMVSKVVTRVEMPIAPEPEMTASIRFARVFCTVKFIKLAVKSAISGQFDKKSEGRIWLINGM